METLPRTIDERLRRRLEEALEGHFRALYRLENCPVPEDLGYDLYYVVEVDDYRSTVETVTRVAYQMSLEQDFDPYVWVEVADSLEDVNDDAAILARREGILI